MNLQSCLLMFLLAFTTLPLNTGFSERGGEGATGNEYRERQNEKKKKKKKGWKPILTPSLILCFIHRARSSPLLVGRFLLSSLDTARKQFLNVRVSRVKTRGFAWHWLKSVLNNLAVFCLSRLAHRLGFLTRLRLIDHLSSQDPLFWTKYCLDWLNLKTCTWFCND